MDVTTEIQYNSFNYIITRVSSDFLIFAVQLWTFTLYYILNYHTDINREIQRTVIKYSKCMATTVWRLDYHKVSPPGRHHEHSCCLASHYTAPVSLPTPSLPLSYLPLSPQQLSTSFFVAHGLLGPHNCQETCGLPGALYTAVPLMVNLTQFQLLWRHTAGKNIQAESVRWCGCSKAYGDYPNLVDLRNMYLKIENLKIDKK